MSSLVYGIVTAKRAAAPAGQSQDKSGPAMGTYIDALTALVPAEALALYAAVVVPYTTQTTSVGGREQTVISDPRLLEWSCAGLLALSSLLYLVGRQKAPFTLSDVARFFIPPMAFTGWLLIQNFSVWDIWWPGSTVGERTVITAFAAVLLGIAASLLGLQADATPGTLTVTGVSPNTGSVAGGASVTVTGGGFTADAPRVPEVSFGTVPASHVAIDDDSKLTVTSPAAAVAGTVDVAVTTSAGGTATKSSADHFTYEAAAVVRPTVTSVSPDTGSVAGGTTVTVTGSGFTGGATEVKFDTLPATNVVVADATNLTVTSPRAGAAGPVDVTVTTAAGTSAKSSAGQFTYEAATVAAMSPVGGSVDGGAFVPETGGSMANPPE
jgi:hypothetical protein